MIIVSTFAPNQDFRLEYVAARSLRTHLAGLLSFASSFCSASPTNGFPDHFRASQQCSLRQRIRIFEPAPLSGTSI
jgi:hypothetical protein